MKGIGENGWTCGSGINGTEHSCIKFFKKLNFRLNKVTIKSI